ncbi:MAG: phosphoglycerate mutase family protein [Candidatus Heimdallarchaeota archaeon]|nr:phosphoglycerate mutase family protein [Candidatus Heimdallarchaeota archaeon]
MKYIELRRHSKRNKSSPHLSQEGVRLAREIGDRLGPYYKVYSSYAPRAIQTAVAMGFAVNEISDEISMTPAGIEKEIKWGMNFDEYANVIEKGYKTAKYSNELVSYLLKLSNPMPESSTLLLISHGGLIEIATIGCVPELDYTLWGEALDECEGVKLTIENKKFTEARLLRIKK